MSYQETGRETPYQSIKNAARGTARWLTARTLGNALNALMAVSVTGSTAIPPDAIDLWNQIYPAIPQEQPEAKPTSCNQLAPVGYQTEKDGSFSYITETGMKINVPKIPGLQASLLRTELKYGKQFVVYNALEENPYGLTVNEWAGRFDPGAVILDARVVLKLMEDNTENNALLPDIEGIPVLSASKFLITDTK